MNNHDSDSHTDNIYDESNSYNKQVNVISQKNGDFEHIISSSEKSQISLCSPLTYTPEPLTLPSRTWMDVTFKVARVASEAIDYEYCPWVKDILAGYGIDDSRYSRYLLGYNPEHYHIKCPNVELEPNNCSNIRIPAGLTIPYIKSFDLLKLVIIKIVGLNRYSRHVVSGGCTDICYTIDHGKYAFRTIVVVDELDAIYINQSLGFNYNVIALGHPDAKPDCYAMDILNKSQYIIIALGNKQGGDAATQWWKDTFRSKVRDLPLVTGKNISQTFTTEKDLSSWALTIYTHKNPSDFINRPTPQPWW